MDQYIVIDETESRVVDLDPMQFQAEWEQRPTTSHKGILRVASDQRTFVEDTLKQKNLKTQTYSSADEAKQNSTTS